MERFSTVEFSRFSSSHRFDRQRKSVVEGALLSSSSIFDSLYSAIRLCLQLLRQVESNQKASNDLSERYEMKLNRLNEFFRRSCPAETNRMNLNEFRRSVAKIPPIDRYEYQLEINGLFSQISSTCRVDFCGFLLCLQTICQRFQLNLTRFVDDLLDLQRDEKPSESSSSNYRKTRLIDDGETE